MKENHENHGPIMELLSKLEAKMEKFPFTIEYISSLGLKDTMYENSEKFNFEDDQLLNDIKQNGEILLLTAARLTKPSIVEFLIRCKVNVNATDENEKLAADHAWTTKNFKILWLLLEADSFFPKGFNLSELKVDDESAEKLKNLVIERNKLHEIIKNGTVDDLISLKLNNSKFYLNITNESAAYAALKEEKFKIYAYLKSIGAEFGNDEEKLKYEKLENSQKMLLQEAMVQYFPPVSNSHIFYLISKSRSQKPVENLSEKLMCYFVELDKIPEISLILKVIQYSDYLDLIFDFEGEEVSNVNPLVSPEENCRGQTEYKLGRIYMAVNSMKRKREEILGTIAHELTHMAMEILYENECNPYRKTDEKCISVFENFKSQIRKNFHKPLLGPSKILMEALHYKPSECDSELIVRIPQILIQFNDGENWLLTNTPDLLDFYKENIKPKCEEFINQSVILKPKSTIKSINESIGEMVTIRKCNIFFKNCHNLLDEEKPVLLCKAKSNLLGILFILQGIYGKNYTDFYNNFLVVKFKNFVMQQDEILRAFWSEATNLLIINITDKPAENELYEVSRSISFVLDEKPNKRILFVTNGTIFEFLRKNLEDDRNFLRSFFKQYFLTELSLNYLDDTSRGIILRKKVIFQEKQTILKNLIDEEDLYKFITPEIIELLLNGERIRIGKKIFDFSDLDGAYSDIFLNVNFDSLVREINNSDSFFIISSKLKDELISYFTGYFSKKWINTEFINQKDYNFKRSALTEKLILVGSNFNNKNFKNFCKNNRGKKNYFIKVENLACNSFTLQQIYNPNFYMKREVNRIIIETDNMKNLVDAIDSEIFVIKNEENLDVLPDRDNVKWVSEGEDQETFKLFSKPGSVVHLFSYEEGYFIWKDSYGSPTMVRKFINPVTDRHLLLEEDQLIPEIFDKKVVLIADNPGMGKSTTLTKLYDAKAITDNHWIIRINLKDYLKAIQETFNEEELDTEKIIHFLQEVEPDLKTELNENFLKIALTVGNKFKKCLLIAFDGFDELLDEEDRKNVIKLLKFLKSETSCKIWITSRLHHKRELEDQLETFAVQFEPFGLEMRKTFVAKYLKDRLNIIVEAKSLEDPKISIFTEQLLEKTSKIFQENESKFIGTPLQLNLVMLDCLEYFKSWVENAFNNALEFDYFGKNLIEVYENFIEKKYKIYFEKSNLIERTRKRGDKKKSEKFNKKLAESLVYKRKALKPDEDDEELILLIGLVHLNNNENFEFIHFTFREYYAALIFFEYLSEESNGGKIIFVFEEILQKPEFEMIRLFLNVLLTPATWSERIHEIKGILRGNDRVLKPFTTLDSALTISAMEGNENIFNLFFSIYDKENLFDITNIFNFIVFLAAATSEKVELWNLIFEIFNRTFSNSKYKMYYKSLIFISALFADRLGLEKSSNILLSKIESFTLAEKHGFVSACNQNMLKMTFQENSSFERFQFITKLEGLVSAKDKFLECLKTPGVTGPNALFTAAFKNDSRFMELLLKKCEEFMDIEEEGSLLTMKDESGRTILHSCSLLGKLDLCKLILNQVKKIFDVKSQGEFLMSTDQQNQTALHYAVFENRIKVADFLIEKGEEILETESFRKYVLMENKWNTTILHVSFKNLFCIESVAFVLQKLEKILPQNDIRQLMLKQTKEMGGGSILHLACDRPYSVLTFVLEELEKILTAEEMRQLLLMTVNRYETPLYIAVQSNQMDSVTLLHSKYEDYFTLPDLRQFWSEYGVHVFNEIYYGIKMEIIRFLIEKAENFLPNGFKPSDIQLIFFSLLRLGSADMVQFFYNNFKKVKCSVSEYQLLSKNDPNVADFLLAAIENKNSEIFELITDNISKNFDKEEQRNLLMTKDELDRTYLYLITRYGLSLKSYKILLEKLEELLSPDEFFQLLKQKPKPKLKINLPDGDNTVLQVSVLSMKFEKVKLILEKADKMLTVKEQRIILMTKNSSNQNVLHVIPPSAPLEIVSIILKKAEDILTQEEQQLFLLPENLEESIFHSAVSFGKFELLNLLLKKSETMLGQKRKDKLIRKTVIVSSKPASMWRYVPTLTSLSSEESKVTYRGAETGKLDLWKTNFDIIQWNLFQNTILHIAVYANNPKILKSLIEYVQKSFSLTKQRKYLLMKNGKNQTIFHAIFSITPIVELESIKFLLEIMGKILTIENWRELLSLKDDVYGSLLHTAALLSNAEIFELLLIKAEKILKLELSEFFLANDEKYGTILHASTLNKDSNVLKLILKKGKQILKQKNWLQFLLMPDEKGRTVLHAAANKKQLKLIWNRETISQKRSGRDHYVRNMKDCFFDSEFTYSILKACEDLPNLKRKQFILEKDKNNKTAIYYAFKCKFLEALRLLLSEGEKLLTEQELNEYGNALRAGS